MIGREIRHILTNDTDLSALVGSRVYADLRGQTNNTVPAIVYRVLDRRKEHSQDLAGLDIYRIEFAIYASTYREVQEIERRLDIALDRYPIGTVINTYIMDGVMQEDSQDDPYDINEDGLREKVCEYSLRVKEVLSYDELSSGETVVGTWIDGSPVYERWVVYSGSGIFLGVGPNSDGNVFGWSLIDVEATCENEIPSIEIEGYFVGSQVPLSASNEFWGGASDPAFGGIGIDEYYKVRYVKKVIW